MTFKGGISLSDEYTASCNDITLIAETESDLQMTVIAQVQSLNYLGWKISYVFDRDIEDKNNKFGHICDVINRHFKYKTRRAPELRRINRLQCHHCFMEVSRGF